jgi:hypothetical protein
MNREQIENLHTEGNRGLRDLDKLAREMNYGSLGNMFLDNPGMIEAIYNFVLDNYDHYDCFENEGE